MTPKRAPRAPNPHVFIHVASPTIPTAWREYLPGDHTGPPAEVAVEAA
jgi:hypothetical protein